MTATPSPTLLSLAGRVESERASQELNADIWLATRVGFSERSFNHWSRAQPKGSNPTELEYARDRAPNFSGSLDAAMTLVPEGMCWRLAAGALMGKYSAACQVFEAGFGVSKAQVETATPATALTAASLRARSALEASHG